jgi:hypothetical protein
MSSISLYYPNQGTIAKLGTAVERLAFLVLTIYAQFSFLGPKAMTGTIPAFYFQSIRQMLGYYINPLKPSYYYTYHFL